MASYDEHRYSDEDEYDYDYLVDCDYCTAKVRQSNYDNHVERVHKCKRCGNCMPKESLAGHIERKHMDHANKRSLSEIIGMIQLDKLSDSEFNRLVNENRIFAKDGHLFRK